MFETKIDQLVQFIQKKRSVGLELLAKQLQMPPQTVELICAVLEKGGILDLNYPINIAEKPTVVFRLLPIEPPAAEDGMGKGKTIASYSFVADGVPASVLISDTEKEKYYAISLVEFGTATKIFLDLIKDELLRALPASVQNEVSDVEKAAAVREEFRSLIRKYLSQFRLGEESEGVLVGVLLHKLFGLGEMDILNQDDWLEEIIINNSKAPLGVYHRRYGWLKTNIYMPDEESIFNYASQIGRRVGRQIAVLTPILDARLETGDRVCATLMPISSNGNTLTIRRFARNPWTVGNLVGEPGYSMTPEMAGMLWQAIHYEMNVIIAGGTASGKTTALNALASFIPPNQRIVTIEDTREIVLPPYQWNWVPLLTRNPNAEGLGEVSMLDLMITSLRMRPDRIVLGEMRRQREAEVLFEAMHTGHSVCSTLHADTGIQALRRLTTPPIDLPPSDLDAINLLVVQYRDRRKNIRRTLEICEIVTGAKEADLATNVIYRWRPRTDTFDMIGEPNKYLKELNLHTGMTKEEIFADIKNRATIIKWMIGNKLTDIESVGRIMALYYGKPKEVLEIAKKSGADKSELKKALQEAA
ncbi:putative KH and PIN-domain containing protein [uncultured archaeon]|nr:putative KH and PIN-domain containing protein [uncultured archaeon]